MEKYSVEHTVESRNGTRSELKFMSTLELLTILKNTTKVHHIETRDVDAENDDETLFIRIYGHYQTPPVEQNDVYRITLKAYDVNEIV